MSDIPRGEGGRWVAGAGSPNPGGPLAKEAERVREVRQGLAKMDTKALGALEKLFTDTDPKVIAKAVELWAKYSLPVPKEVVTDAPKDGERPRLKPEVARALAALNLDS